MLISSMTDRNRFLSVTDHLLREENKCRITPIRRLGQPFTYFLSFMITLNCQRSLKPQAQSPFQAPAFGPPGQNPGPKLLNLVVVKN
jgi:hypothetical protein